jgi:hypothetical protein
MACGLGFRNRRGGGDNQRGAWFVGLLRCATTWGFVDLSDVTGLGAADLDWIR